MQVQTTRFGTITINESDLIHFNEGLLGFSDLRKFVLLDDPHDEIFAWLQSCEKPSVAFPILEPELFAGDYKPTLTKNDLQSLHLDATSRQRLFAIITIPDDVTQMTANLKAPVVINVKTRTARQIVVQENDLPIKFPVFMELQKRVVQNPQADIKSQAVGWGVAVRLPVTEPVVAPKASELNV
jgi:flagellar assembly factor FliW